MKKLVLTGDISQITREAYNDQDSWTVVTDQAELKTLLSRAHGDDSFADYNDDWYEHFCCGEMAFHMAAGVPKLTVTYTIDPDTTEVDEDNNVIILNGNDQRVLSDVIDEIISYTRGQLSDGIGEGFEQNPCYETDTHMYFISPGYPELESEIING